MQMSSSASGREEELLRKLLVVHQELAAVHPDEQVIWQLVVDRARSLAGADGALIQMVEGECLVCRAVSGDIAVRAGSSRSIDSDLTSLAVRREEALTLNDLESTAVPGADRWRELGIRSLLAVPVPHQYYLVGVLAVVSRRVSVFGPLETQMLQLLTYGMSGAINRVVAEGAKKALLAEHTRTILALRESEERFRSAFDLAPIGMALIGMNGTWIKVNRTLCELLGRTEESITRTGLEEVVHPEDLHMHLDLIQRLVCEEVSNVQAEMRWFHSSGAVIWVLFSASLLKDGQGKPRYLIGQIQDITQRKRDEEQIHNSLREKDVLLKEIHHRVKNNLQVISSLLNLQAGYSSDPGTNELFKESQNRVRSMALIHENLYQSQDIGRVNLHEYVGGLVSMLFRVYGTDPACVRWEADIAECTLNIDTAVPVGLIIHELVSNALKYAFPNSRRGTIRIGFRSEPGGFLTLRFADDGVGMPKEFEIDKTASLGLRLVKILTGQLGGELNLHSDPGTEFTIRFNELKK